MAGSGTTLDACLLADSAAEAVMTLRALSTGVEWETVKLGAAKAVDNYLIAESNNVRRQVHEPTRHPGNPLLTPRQATHHQLAWTRLPLALRASGTGRQRQVMTDAAYAICRGGITARPEDGRRHVSATATARYYMLPNPNGRSVDFFRHNLA